VELANHRENSVIKYTVIEWTEAGLRLLDQRKLPDEMVYITCQEAGEVAAAIQEMVIRGAPAIGIAAGYGLALAAARSQAGSFLAFLEEINVAAAMLRVSRPTAVNLFWAIERVVRRVNTSANLPIDALKRVVLEEAHAIAAENAQMNRQMGLNALPLIPPEANIIHHCNTGPLATGEHGTALGVIITAHQHGRKVHVYVDETRPRLQGARLTAWELQQYGIPHTVVVDGASGYLMSKLGIDLCLVGCDRVVANGDTANKIGTYNLALVAQAHGVPLYVVGPTRSIDLSILSGEKIPIEERPPDEITTIGSYRITPGGVDIFNPAFDVTPARYITGIITERGIAYPPFKETLAKIIAG